MKQVTDLLANYQSLRSSLVKYSRQVASVVRRQLTLVEHRSGEVLAETESLVNHLTRRVEQELSVQLKRVIDYKDTVLTGLSVLQNTIQGTNLLNYCGSNQCRGHSNSHLALAELLFVSILFSTGLTTTKNFEFI